MNKGLKLLIYAALLAVCCVAGYFTIRDFNKLLNKDRTRALPGAEAAKPAGELSPIAASPSAPASSENLATDTNVVAATPQPPATSGSETNAAPSGVSTPPQTASTPDNAPTPAAGGSQETHFGISAGFFLLSLAILGLMVAKDFANFLGDRALDVLYNEDRAGVKDPEYDEAEEIWARGDHLDAIRHLRDYLARNPREIHAAIRIAEIYEKDMGNNLAAALEYEDILKCKLSPDRWGWTAIHLCNLYFRLQQDSKAVELLQRLILEHGQTPAAEKARKRLEQMGLGLPDPIPEEGDAQAEADQAASNLPAGFKPRKRW